VLLSKLNPRIPRIWLPEPNGKRRSVTSTEFLVLKSHPGVTRDFIYAKCCSEEFAGQFASLAIGTSTSHQRVKPENLLVIPSIVPDRKSIERFTRHISPMLASSQQLRAIIQNLGQTCDLLLPRLLSGQIALIARRNAHHRGRPKNKT
jgi:type I restriction enzyme, S subunit